MEESAVHAYFISMLNNRNATVRNKACPNLRVEF